MRIHLGFISSGLIAAALAACGSSSSNFDGSATITYQGDDVSASHGLAVTENIGNGSVFGVYVGTGGVSCNDFTSSSAGAPPDGTYAVLVFADDTVGTDRDVSLSVEAFSGGTEADAGTDGADTADITASDGDSVSVNVDIDFTDPDTSDDYALHGTFTVDVCN